MSSIPVAAWIALAGVLFVVALAALYALGCRLEREVQEHTLRVKSARLREDYSRWIEALRRGEGDTVERPPSVAAAQDRHAA